MAPLKSVLQRKQQDEKEFVARTVMKINTRISGAYIFSSGKNMGAFKAASTGWMNTKATAGPPMAAIPPTPPVGGAAPTHSLSSITQSFTTEKFHPTTPTDVL